MEMSKYLKEDIKEILEEYPKLKNTSPEELRMKAYEFSQEASVLYERVCRLNSKAHCLEMYAYCKEREIDL